MIVRILTEGQYNLPGAYIDQLNDIDNQLVEVVEEDNQEGFERLLKSMLDLVRDNGTPVPLDDIVESDLVQNVDHSQRQNEHPYGQGRESGGVAGRGLRQADGDAAKRQTRRRRDGHGQESA